MSGGILQLVARGPDDLFLISTPEITNFKIVYRRHTNFMSVPFKLHFNKLLHFGESARCRIGKLADLVYELYLIVELPEVKLKYPAFRKDYLAKKLLEVGIVWTYSGEPSDEVTAEDIIEVEQLITVKISTLSEQIAIIDEQIKTMDNIYKDNPDFTGREYANAVFSYLMQNTNYETLYQYFLAYRQDVLTSTKYIYNYDDAHIFVYNFLLWFIQVRAIPGADELQIDYLAGIGLYRLTPYTETVNPFLTDLDALHQSRITLQDMATHVVFYQVIEFGNYIFNNSMKNYDTITIFNKALEFGFAKTIIDTNNDAYKVYTKYFNQLVGTLQERMTDQNTVTVTLQELLDNIHYNMLLNFQQIIDIGLLLSNKTPFNYVQVDPFRIGLIKNFRFISTSEYDGDDEFKIIIDTTPQLNDNFSDTLAKPLFTAPSDVTPFFINQVNQAAEEFKFSLRDIMNTANFSDYFKNIKLWDRLQLEPQLGAAYSSLSQLRLLDLIPLYIIDDIPNMVYNNMLADPFFTNYAAFFDLRGSPFSTSVHDAIIDNYLSYDTNPGNNILVWLQTMNTKYLSGDNIILTELFLPEALLNINTIGLSSPVINSNESYTYLIPLEYVITSYAVQYRKMIVSFTANPTTQNQFIEFIVNKNVELFRTPIASMPTYQNYVNNNYTLFNIAENAGNVTTTTDTPPYLDAASSIWYALTLNMISNFKDLFFNTLLSTSLYQNDLGTTMNDMLTIFKHFLSEMQLPQTIGFPPPDTNTLENLDFYRISFDASQNQVAAQYLQRAYQFVIVYYNLMFTSAYQAVKNIYKIKDLGLNRPVNYFRSINDMVMLFVNEMQNNPQTYGTAYDSDIYPTYLPNLLLSFLNSNNTEGVIDIKYDVRNDLNGAISSVPINPYPSGTARFTWFNNYLSTITPALLTQFDSIVSVLSDTDTYPQYKDPLTTTLYNNFSQEQYILDYFADLTVKQVNNYGVFVNKITSTSTQTHTNFVDILNAIKLIDTTILDKIAIHVGNRYVFIGSPLYIEFVNLFHKKRPPFAWAKEIGHRIIEDIGVNIGGQMIDKHSGDWLRVFHMLTIDPNKERAYNIMIGNTRTLTTYDSNRKPTTMLYIPLQFWFSRSAAEALPLVAMNFTDVEIYLKLRKLEECAIWDPSAIFAVRPAVKCQLLTHYIYVEMEERKRIAESRLEYLVELTQNSTMLNLSSNELDNNVLSTRLYFTNPCKMLVWQVRFLNIEQTQAQRIDWTNNNVYIDGKKIVPIERIKIQFNGRERETYKTSDYYNLVQSHDKYCGSLDEGIYMYSFAIYPLELQPSGACNLSKISELSLVMELNPKIVDALNNKQIKIEMIVWNYYNNWLRIISGMSGLAFYGEQPL